jgi:glycosyltransferase involved in cell wall biosynthesis
MIIFSLILPTIGRINEIRELFGSLAEQEEKSFEVIVVDQNLDDRIRVECECWNDAFSINYIHSMQPGLSLNRNIGLGYATGEIIAFPDDDCKYRPDTLMRVRKRFEANNDVQMVFGQMIDPSSNLKWNNFPENSMYVKKQKLFKFGCSASLFINKGNIVDGMIVFDEKFGIGAEFGGAEETDLVFRLMRKNYKGYYDTSVMVYHSYQVIGNTPQEKAFQYGKGIGAFFRKNGNYYVNFMCFIEMLLVRPIGGMLVRLIKGDYKAMPYYYSSLKGKWIGFFRFK